jgi:hypothetical protein
LVAASPTHIKGRQHLIVVLVINVALHKIREQRQRALTLVIELPEQLEVH